MPDLKGKIKQACKQYDNGEEFTEILLKIVENDETMNQRVREMVEDQTDLIQVLWGPQGFNRPFSACGK